MHKITAVDFKITNRDTLMLVTPNFNIGNMVTSLHKTSKLYNNVEKLNLKIPKCVSSEGYVLIDKAKAKEDAELYVQGANDIHEAMLDIENFITEYNKAVDNINNLSVYFYKIVSDYKVNINNNIK